MPKTTHCALRTWRLKPELVAYNAITNSTSSSARGLHMGDINPLPLNLIWHHFKFNLSDVLAKNCICIVPTMHVHRIMLFLPRWHIKNRNLLGQSHDPSTLKITCTFPERYLALGLPMITTKSFYSKFELNWNYFAALDWELCKTNILDFCNISQLSSDWLRILR